MTAAIYICCKSADNWLRTHHCKSDSTWLGKIPLPVITVCQLVEGLKAFGKHRDGEEGDEVGGEGGGEDEAIDQPSGHEHSLPLGPRQHRQLSVDHRS